MSHDPPRPNPDTLLRSPLRQTLVLLLWHQSATAGKLEEVTRHPRKVLDYHLKVLVNEGWLEVDQNGKELIYSAVPKAHLALPLGDGDLDRVLALTFLDATWATLGTATDIPLDAVLKTFAVDDVGLSDGSKLIQECLEGLEQIVTESRQRADSEEKGTSHQIVAVASLVPVERRRGDPEG